MRDYKQEFEKRVAFIKEILKESHADGIVFGNSGGKDCALVGILCKAACENTVGIILPCSSKRNYDEDTKDALSVANKFNIKTETLDVTPIKTALLNELEKIATPNNIALTNIAPRLRMTSLYAYAASNNMLVAGTGNRSEVYVGYFTKWSVRWKSRYGYSVSRNIKDTVNHKRAFKITLLILFNYLLRIPKDTK